MTTSNSNKRSNKSLREKYEAIYKHGEEKYFSKFEQGVDLSETNIKVLELIDWRGKSVADVGCGTGALLREISKRGASRVTGIDYSKNAIDIARSHSSSQEARYIVGDILEIPSTEHDVVISCGTIEHSDAPDVFLNTLNGWCKEEGSLIISCPNFINIRGFVWMALAVLQDVPMSLTDLHFIHPWQMKEWCNQVNLQVCDFRTCDYEQGNGSKLVADFDNRLRNALRDAGLENKNVPTYLEYLEQLIGYLDGEELGQLQGATAVYVLKRVA